MKFPLYCFVLSITLSYVWARAIIDEGEACIVQYLKNKQKLSSDFPSTLQPSEGCDFSIPLGIRVMREIIVEEIKKNNPAELECLTNEFDNRETIDQFLKISIITESKKLSENEAKTQLEATRSQLKQDVEKIAIQCNTDVKSFTNIFNEALGVKNETLEVFQFEYCISKYAADNSLLPLNNIELNIHNIDLENLNCDDIVEKERAKTVHEIRDKLISTHNGDKVFECVSDAFKRDNIFDWSLALKVLYIVDLPKETKASEKSRVTQKVAGFVGSTFTCAISNL